MIGLFQSCIVERNLRGNSTERTSQEVSVAGNNLPAEQCGVEIPQSKPTVVTSRSRRINTGVSSENLAIYISNA